MTTAINIEQWTGSSGSPTKTSISSGSTITSGSADTTSPPSVPQDNTGSGGGFRFTFWTYTRLNCTAVPLGIVNNVQWYCSTTLPSDYVSTFNSGYNMTCNVVILQNSTFYQQATGTVNVTGNALAGSSYGGGGSVFTVTAASPAFPGGQILNTTTVPTDAWGGLAVYQFGIPPKFVNSSTQTGVTPGTKSALTFNWQYDEV